MTQKILAGSKDQGLERPAREEGLANRLGIGRARAAGARASRESRSDGSPIR